MRQCACEVSCNSNNSRIYHTKNRMERHESHTTKNRLYAESVHKHTQTDSYARWRDRESKTYTLLLHSRKAKQIQRVVFCIVGNIVVPSNTSVESIDISVRFCHAPFNVFQHRKTRVKEHQEQKRKIKEKTKCNWVFGSVKMIAQLKFERHTIVVIV